MFTFKQKQLAAFVSKAFVGCALVSFSAAGFAQQTPTERIEVTGSRIKRTDAESSSPLITISREDIEKSGCRTSPT